MSAAKLGVEPNKICCIGAGYVGGPTMATIAKKCPHIQVHIVDMNKPRIDAWNSENLPIYEPGLMDVVQEARGRNLFFSTDVAQGIKDADIIFASVNTPTKTQGVGAGRAADLKYIESVGRTIAEHANKDKIVIEKSTVPVKTAEALGKVLNANALSGGKKFYILSNPEFLAEGTAMKDLDAPDRVLIGGQNADAIQVLVDIYANWVPNEQILTTNLWSSELSKLVANAMLAQRVSSINSIARLCERTGANVHEVSRAIGTDSRIGSKFLSASIGFGGSCFQKDILNLVYLCEQFGLPEVAHYWQQVVDMNEHVKQHFTRKLIETLFNTVSNKKIAILGFAFKKDTGDVRETPALTVCHMLMQDGANLFIYDPKVDIEDAKTEFKYHNIEVPEKQFHFVKTVDEAVEGAHSIVILTEWDEFKTYDYGAFYGKMMKPASLFDGRNMVNHEALEKIGFEVHAIGRGKEGGDDSNRKAKVIELENLKLENLKLLDATPVTKWDSKLKELVKMKKAGTEELEFGDWEKFTFQFRRKQWESPTLYGTSGCGGTNRKLVVFLPGTGGCPADYSEVTRAALDAGNDVIGLSYVGSPLPVSQLAKWCKSTATLVAGQEGKTPSLGTCMDALYTAIAFGADDAIEAQTKGLWAPRDDKDGRVESIEGRLAETLKYLAEENPVVWDRYLESGAPNWINIIISGHSQGGSLAAFIAAHRPTRCAAVLFSAPQEEEGCADSWLEKVGTRNVRVMYHVSEECGDTPDAQGCAAKQTPGLMRSNLKKVFAGEAEFRSWCSEKGLMTAATAESVTPASGSFVIVNHQGPSSGQALAGRFFHESVAHNGKIPVDQNIREALKTVWQRLFTVS